MPSVKIGPEFFINTKRDYNDWKFAIIRELVQNSVDCGSKNINLFVSKEDEKHIKLVCENDGEPMDQNTLINKLLCLGGSTKTDSNSVGGFGVAKNLIYLMHQSYQIETGNLVVTGSGADYELSSGPFLNGTRSTMIIEVDFDQFVNRINFFASMAQLDVKLYLGGQLLDTNSGKGYFRREFEFGRVYTTKQFSNRVVARMRGIPMFHYWSDFDRGIIIELAGSSTKYLTSNRDGLTITYKSTFDKFLYSLAVDSVSALRPITATIEKWSGPKLGGKLENNLISQLITEYFAETSVSNKSTNPSPAGLGSDQSNQEFVRSIFCHEFYIKNELGMAIPEYFTPSVNMSHYARSLVKIWVKALVGLHTVLQRTESFSVGFVFSGDCAAQYQGDGNVFYINPIQVVKSSAGPRSLQRRFKLTWKDQILALAVHEFAHIKHKYHDEQYAGHLTDLMSVALKHRSKMI